MGGTIAQLPAGWQMSLSGHRAYARAVHQPTNPFSAHFMALKESALCSSLWEACDDPLGDARE
jgi:hypothetical protein